MIPIFSPNVGKDELREIEKVFSTKWLGRGRQEANFKRGLANRLGVPEGNLCLTSTCTELIFAFIHLFVPKGKTILLPTISFPAIGSAVVENNVDYKLVDVDEDGNLDINAVRHLLEKEDVGAIFATHYGSASVDIAHLRDIVGEDVLILEDAACALGGSVDGKAIGTSGDFACWSFDAMKLITVGDGGMGYCKKLDHAQILREYLYLGLPEKEKSGLDKSKEGSGWWEYSLLMPGRRAIMNDIAAAIGNVQLAKMDDFLQARRRNIHQLNEALSDVGDIRVVSKVDAESSAYYFTIETNRRDDLAVHLKNNGIYTTFRYWPLHRMPLFASRDKFPTADRIAQNFLNLPCHNNLSSMDLEKIIVSTKQFFV